MTDNPLFDIDFYKVDHRRQYPEGTTEIYSNFTPRYVKTCHSLLPDFDNKVVVFGVQYLVKKYLVERWNNGFFLQDKAKVIAEYCQVIMDALGLDEFDCSHLEALHDLGYLPIRVKAIEEGLRVPIGVPVLTIVNTHPDFFWLTNYLETIISATLWKAITCATIAFEFKRLLLKYAKDTGADESFVDYQLHDFSFRGMSGLEDAAICGAAHLTSFVGTDCVPAIPLLKKYYHAQQEGLLIASSVPATEHSVMCCNGSEGEFETIKRLITEVYPTGIVSIVADSYNLWQTLTVYLPSLYKEINERQGKVVIRPDSGDPFDIICGDMCAQTDTPAHKGTLRLLWELFGGRVNSSGFRELNPRIGLIYGDAITVERASKILERMKEMGFASTNIVFGVGSYTYQYVTRDTFGFAMKATSAVIHGDRVAIYKNPITGAGKKSAKGLLRVWLDEKSDYEFYVKQDVSKEEEKSGWLDTVLIDGNDPVDTDLDIIRRNVWTELGCIEI